MYTSLALPLVYKAGHSSGIKVRPYLWYILCVDAVDGVADVLLGGHNEGEGEHTGGGYAVVQPTFGKDIDL